MALPDTREYNYAPKVEVRSADLNTWQDWIAAGANVVIRLDVLKAVNIENFTFNANYHVQTVNASAAALVPLDLPEGWTIINASARGSDTGSNAAPSVSIAKRTGDTAPAAIAGGDITGFSAFPATLSLAAPISELIAVNTSYSFLLQTPGGWTPGIFAVTQLSITLKRASVPAVPAP